MHRPHRQSASGLQATITGEIVTRRCTWLFGFAMFCNVVALRPRFDWCKDPYSSSKHDRGGSCRAESSHASSLLICAGSWKFNVVCKRCFGIRVAVELVWHRFIMDNDLNERAAEALRSVPRQVQEQVPCQRITFFWCEVSAWKRCTLSLGWVWNRQIYYAFFNAPWLALRLVDVVEHGGKLQEVLGQGPLRGCREPSASCIGRISEAQQLGKSLILWQSDPIAHSSVVLPLQALP